MPPDPDDVTDYYSSYAGCLSEEAQQMLRNLMKLRPDKVRGALGVKDTQPCDHHNARLVRYCPDCGQMVTR